MDTSDQNIIKMPSTRDREFFRVDGQVYFYCEPVEVNQGMLKDQAGLFIPTFDHEEDDFVGLAIDAFREELLNDDVPNKDYFLKIQQLLSMTKRFFDVQFQGKQIKRYRKIPVNISGSGLCFPSDVAYDKDALIRIAMFFPRFPFKFVSVIASVVKSDKVENRFDVKVKFHELSEKCQDDILRFVNQCQRDSRNRL